MDTGAEVRLEREGGMDDGRAGNEFGFYTGCIEKPSEECNRDMV